MIGRRRTEVKPEGYVLVIAGTRWTWLGQTVALLAGGAMLFLRREGLTADTNVLLWVGAAFVVGGFGLPQLQELLRIEGAPNARLLTLRRPLRRGVRVVSLAKLATVDAAGSSTRPALALMDRDGLSVVLPLRRWFDEETVVRLLAEAATRNGVTFPGNLEHARGGFAPPRWLALAGIGLASILLSTDLRIAVAAAPAPRVPPVTASSVARDAGGTRQPFGSLTFRCGVSLVPLDLPSIEVTRTLADDLHRLLPDVPVCTTPSFTLDAAAIDPTRRQLNGRSVAEQLIEPLRQAAGATPLMVLGVTHHDLFFTERPDLAFDTDYELPLENGQTFVALSTARLGKGDVYRHRLDVLAVRAVGFGYYVIPYTEDDSALHFHLSSLADLDRLTPALGDPPYTAEQLAFERQRFLDSVSRR